MKRFWVLLMFGLMGCDVADPLLLTGPVDEGVTAGALINASVSVLHEQGYIV